MPNGLAALTFVVGAAYLPGILSAATAPRWWVLAIGAPLLALTTPFRTISLGHWLGAALLVFVAAGLSWSTSPWDTVEGLVAIAVLAVVFALAAEQDDLTPCWIALAAAAWVSAAVMLAQVSGLEAVLNVATGPSGLFLSKNMMAEFAVLGLVAALALRRWVLAVGPAVCLVLPFALGEPSAETIVALLSASVVGLLAFARRPSKLVLASLGAVLLAGGAATAWMMVHKLESSTARQIIWNDVAGNLTWLGSGLNTFADRFPIYEFGHSEPVQLAFELGIPGLALIVGILIYAVTAPDRWREKALLAALAACCLVWWPMRAPATAMVGALLAGHLCGVRARRVVLEPARRVVGVASPESGSEPLGVGSLWPTRGVGLGVADGPQHSMVGRALPNHVERNR